MKFLSPLLGYLGKSGTKTNTPEEGDTRMTVPGLMSLVLTPPFPFFSFYSTAQGQLVPVNSWIISISQTFAVSDTIDLMALGPGVWDVTVRITVEEAGAISDATSTISVGYFANDGTGSTVILVSATNKQGVNHTSEISFRQTVTSDQLYVFRRTRVAGLGTGLNVAKILILASRLF